MKRHIRLLGRDSKAATAIEYAMLLCLIALGILTALTALGGKLNTTFNNVSTNLKLT
jgi:pilus assembly protein Flp/PilA